MAVVVGKKGDGVCLAVLAEQFSQELNAHEESKKIQGLEEPLRS
jgi:hypothetical protein